MATSPPVDPQQADPIEPTSGRPIDASDDAPDAEDLPRRVKALYVQGAIANAAGFSFDVVYAWVLAPQTPLRWVFVLRAITVLLYLNENWQQPGGRLRILKNGTNVEDYVAEVPPDNGTLLVFKRSDNSWHGHHPFEGPRRSLQMNWMTSEGSKGFHAIRHKLSAAVKKVMTG